MRIKEKIDAIKDYLSANLPGDLSTLGIADFENYLGDVPDNPEARQLCVYMDRDEYDEVQDRFEVIIQAQLYKILTRDSWDYQDAIKKRLKQFNPDDIDEMKIERISSENFPIFENDSTIIIFQYQFATPVDDCTFPGV